MSAVGERPAGGPGALWRELVDLVRAVSRFLLPAHKRRLLTVSLWACGVSALEMLVAAAVVPYVQCLGGQCPVLVETSVSRTGGALIPTISLGLFLLIALKLAVQAGFHWNQVRFTQTVQRDTLSRLLEGYLHLDWMVFRAQHRAHYFRRCATTAVDAAYVSHQCVVLISSGLIVLFLTALMLWLYPFVSLALIVGFLGLAVLVQALMGRAQKQAGRAREAALQRWNIGMAEAFSAFREIRVYGLETFFHGRLEQAVDALAGANRKLEFFPALPRLILDFAILGIVLLAVSLWLTLGRPVTELLPLLVFFAVVARSVLPAMMNLLSTRAVLYGSIVNIELVLEEFRRNREGRIDRIGIGTEPAERAYFRLDAVVFRHAPGIDPVLRNASLTLDHPSWVALVGASGAGKSTLMELLCGIHVPEAGQVIYGWPGAVPPRIAYIPQAVTLLDGTVMENVVFGFDAGDAARVQDALGIACLSEVVEALPGGLLSRVGADGSRLSGGERQRLALARALYRTPDLLLLDEATSGLDEATEARLFTAMRRQRPAMSVLYITHRSNNLRFADRIARLEDGGVDTMTSDRVVS